MDPCPPGWSDRSAAADERGQLLLRIARTALEEHLGSLARNCSAPTSDLPEVRSEPWLNDRAATFVSLHKLGQLRGCVGTLDAVRSLYDDVRHNALAAALEDTRFPPVEHLELGSLQIEVTLLSTRERIACSTEREALELLRPGVDGVLLSWSGRRATFLPQVWESLPEPRRFLRALKEKAGLSQRFWDGALVLERYAARSWSEDESPAAGTVM
jgi:AmmeMemoRadiSam system protein A